MTTTPQAIASTSHGPWYRTAKFWKRFSVFVSILLSVASLTLSALASLRKQSSDELKALTVTGLIVNSISIALSALTSLDWQSTATKEKKFAQQLLKVMHAHDGAQVVLLGKGGGEESS